MVLMLVESQYGNIDQITKQALLSFGNNLSIWFFHDNVLFTSKPRNLRWFVSLIMFKLLQGLGISFLILELNFILRLKNMRGFSITSAGKDLIRSQIIP